MGEDQELGGQNAAFVDTISGGRRRPTRLEGTVMKGALF